MSLEVTRKMKFSANISSLLIDIPDLKESYREIRNRFVILRFFVLVYRLTAFICVYCRKEFKFKAVEVQDPYKIKADEWKKELESIKDSKPEFVLINSPAVADKFAGRIPTVEEFDSILKTTGEYVEVLGARKVHLLLTDIKDSSQL